MAGCLSYHTLLVAWCCTHHHVRLFVKGRGFLCCGWASHTWQFPLAHAGLLLRTLFGSEGQGHQQQDAPLETSPYDSAEGSQQHAPASSEAEAAAEQPASGAERHAEPDFPDAAGGAAGEVSSSRGAQAGYGWPATTRPATYTGFATGTQETACLDCFATGTPATAPHSGLMLQLGGVPTCCRT